MGKAKAVFTVLLLLFASQVIGQINPPTRVARAKGANPGDEVVDRDTGATRLMMANLKEAELLLKKGANVNARDKRGVTALLLAAYGQSSEHVRLFLRFKAKPGLKDDEGRTALIHSVRWNSSGAMYNGESPGCFQRTERRLTLKIGPAIRHSISCFEIRFGTVASGTLRK